MEPMYRERKAFMRLVSDLCKELSYPERDEALRDDETLIMEMTLEGIVFNVSHSLHEHPEKILIQAVFGPLPGERRADVLYRIMHLNRELSETGLATIGYDTAAGMVVYAHAAVLAELSGATLLNTMTEITWRAEYWQSTYFLQDDGQRVPEKLNEQFISLA
jgi:hypothetical protein